ncbi:heterokaryon incompatibility protein-domain-containing protein [Corynascus similis CBS 632.67]
MSQPQTPRATDAHDHQPECHYKYESLPDGPFIRYLILHPASADTDPLACTLRTTHIDETPHFEAISYVWGVPVKNQPLICNGKVSYITANLRDALRQVRLPDRSRTLWADSICINQEDSQEQGHQISLMGRIYGESSCTLVCLGTASRAHAPIVADLLADVNRMVHLIFEQEDFSWAPNSFPFPEKGHPLVSHPGWTSFGVLLQHPWFRRGWVV